MTHLPLHFRRSGLPWQRTMLLALAIAVPSAIIGCKESDSITSYRVPRRYIEDEQQAEKAAAVAPNAGAGMATPPTGGRMLAAMIDHGPQAWFFKLTGEPAEVEKQAEPFNSLIKSVRFEAGENAAPQWTLPDGWREQGKSGLRHNTLLTAGPKPLEVSVTVLPKPPGDDAAYALSNINRWRGQLALPPLDAARLAEETTKVPLAEGTAIVVDLRAAGGGAAANSTAATDKAESGAVANRMLAAILADGERAWFFKLTGPADAVEARQGEFDAFLKSLKLTDDAERKPQWTLPDGWRQQPGSGLRFATLLLGEGAKPLELTVTTLAKPPGDDAEYLLSNINRWRGQMQLAPIEAGALAQETATVDTPAGKATVVNLLGKAAAGGIERGPFSQGNR